MPADVRPTGLLPPAMTRQNRLKTCVAHGMAYGALVISVVAP